MKIGERIRTEREAQAMSRRRLSDLSGVPYPTLAGIENGDQDSSTQLPEIANALGVNPAWLKNPKAPKHLVSEPVENYQVSRLDHEKLATAIQFLERVFREHEREFVAADRSLVIAAVYDELQKSDSPNWVALTVKVSRMIGENDEREDAAGSTGKVDQGRTGKRARKA